MKYLNETYENSQGNLGDISRKPRKYFKETYQISQGNPSYMLRTQISKRHPSYMLTKPIIYVN